MTNSMGYCLARENGPHSSNTTKVGQIYTDSDEVCDICESTEHKTPQSNQPGTNKKNASYARNVRKNHKFPKKKCKTGFWSQHPWYIEPKCFQVHHLIEGQAIDDPRWEVICHSLGYDINDARNCVCLPALPQLACALNVPLHRGNHDTAKTDIVDRTLQTNINEEAYLNYPAAVSQKIEIILRDSIKNCSTPRTFRTKMNQASRFIFNKVKQFKWHLRADGAQYARGEVGCQINGNSEHGLCFEKSKKGAIKMRHHIQIRKKLQTRRTFQLKLGF